MQDVLRILSFLPAFLALVSLNTAAFAEDKKDALPDWKRYTVDKPGYFNREKPTRTVDPVTAMTGEEIARFEGAVEEAAFKDLHSAFVDRAEEAYRKISRPPEGFFEWLKGHAQLRETFLLAMNPYYDDPIGAVKILNELRIEEPEKVIEYFHLAVAIAVVWDTRDAVFGSRYNCVGGIAFNQYLPLPGPVDVFRWFTDKKNAPKFALKVKDIVWPIAVHLADNDVSIKEAEWALRRFEKQKENIGSLYEMVEYDNGKAGDKNQQGKLGNREYILPNVLEFGGICGDQAHFCSRTAKCFAIPAMKAGGLSRFGGEGHAFTCFFTKKKNRLIMESTGRFFYDFYYTGEIYDAQTRVEILDRNVAMLLDGASLSYEKYMVSNVFARIAAAVYKDHPEISLILVKRALQQNWFCAEGWKILMRLIRDQIMPREEGITWANSMMKCAKDHPDLTIACFTTFLDCISREEADRRQAFYKQAFSLYNERPDLQVDLRLLQGRELIDFGRDREGVELLMSTAAEHAKEGRLINDLVKAGVEAAKRTSLERNLFPHLEKIASRYPKKRGDTIAEAFKELVGMIAPIYESAGKTKEAARLRAEAELY